MNKIKKPEDIAWYKVLTHAEAVEVTALDALLDASRAMMRVHNLRRNRIASAANKRIWRIAQREARS